MDYINNDIYMIDNDIPLIAYIYVGITSLVLAYVTYNDETNRDDGKYKSNTNTPILPAFLTGASENQTPNGTSANTGTTTSGSILPTFLTGESKPATPPPPPATTNPPSILPSFMQPQQPVVRGGKRKQTKGAHKKSKSNKSKKHK